MTTQTLDPAFAAALRRALVDEVTGQPSVARRRRRRTIAGVITAAVLGVAGGTAYAITEALPGGTRTTVLASPVVVVRSGTATVDLGARPDGTTSVSTELTCMSPGRFGYPDGASMVCDPSDFSGTAKHPALYVLALAPGQHEVTITASAGASWQLSATYVSTETTDWGVNAKGETYGVVNERGEPDLVAVEATNRRQCYASVREMNAATGPPPSSPEEAAARARESAGKTYSVPVYESDGETVIGEFVIGG